MELENNFRPEHYNQTETPLPPVSGVLELFKHQVELKPHAIALLQEKGDALNYNDLDKFSNQISHYLRDACGVQHGSIVGLMLERGPYLVPFILGVLKTGAAYIPIDPEYPNGRIKTIISGSGMDHLICDNRREPDQLEVALIDTNVVIPELHAYSDKSLAIDLSSDDLAYIIYTSGSTGKPKGVMIEHSSLLNYIHWASHYYLDDKAYSFALFSSISFDLTITSIFVPLVTGNRIVVYGEQQDDQVSLISRVFQDHRSNIIKLTPSHLRLVREMTINTSLAGRKKLIVGGEQLETSLASSIYTLFDEKVEIYNEYGPTESTVGCMFFQFEPGSSATNVPIGLPIANVKVYLLDHNHNPVPVGVPGELYIGGLGLSRGYFRDETLTKERFAVINKLGEGRLYRTGDTCRWLSGGKMEYLNRIDDQVKLNGYRIELGEIENTLYSFSENIESAVSVVRNHGNMQAIIAFIVEKEPVDLEALKSHIKETLPHYMVPGHFELIPAIPLTVNGKTDKKALEVWPLSYSGGAAYSGARNETDQRIIDIWQEVLGIERVGIENSFFELGGNSLMAIQVSHQISSALEVSVTVADIFKWKTISGILSHLNEQTASVITPHHDKEAVLSYAQERLWFIERFNEGTDAYHIPLVFELLPETNMKALKEAIRKVVLRHEVLRSTIYDQNGIGIQRVNESPIDISEVTIPNGKLPSELLAEEAKRPFDLSQEYPLRVSFYTSETEKYQNGYLQLVFHHIATDGWSLDLFYRELGACYAACVKGEGQSPLPALSIQYKDYAQWQKQHFQSEALADQLAHWQSKLSGFEPLEFPTDFPRPRQSDFRGASVTLDIPDSVSQRLRDLAVELGTTLHSVLLGSFHVLLSKYTGQNDIITGSPIANRHHAQTADLIGFFVNTQVNRTELGPDESFSDLLKRVHEDQVQAQLHQDLPFEQLVEALEVERDISRHPIFQIMFTVEKKQDLGRLGDTLKPVVSEKGDHSSKFDLTIDIEDHSGQLSVVFTYAKSLFESSTIERLADYYVHLLDKVSVNPTGIYSKLSLLSPAEEKQILYDWNETEEDFTSDNDKTLAMLFEEQVENTPDATALVFGSEKLTYSELNEASNRLARIVRQTYKSITNKELAPDDLIGLYLERGLEMVVGILAVLKAGGAYVPIDANSPVDRTSYILEDTDARLVLSQKACHERMPETYPKEQVLLIDLSSSLYRENQRNNLAQHSQSSDLAYVIYTSGTSGKPKGVMVEQTSVVNLVNFHHKRSAEIADQLQFLLITGYQFDFAVQQMFNAILFGNSLHIIPKRLLLDPPEFNAYILENQIEVIEFTPSLFSILMLPFDNYAQSKLKLINIGGEKLNVTTIREFLMKSIPGGLSILNSYGPTEYTVDTAVYEIAPGAIDQLPQDSIPIGKPLSNTKLYVLDKNHVPVPVGITGELHVSGAGLARGYLNAPDLTQEKFISNPIITTGRNTNRVAEKVYKTGDLVKWLPDGNLIYLGRSDSQIKVRGFRIELSEIERVIQEINGINQAVVILREVETEFEENRELLYAYYVPEQNGESPGPDKIETILSRKLPEYMLPDSIIRLESLPTTNNGKVDVKHLVKEPVSLPKREEKVAGTLEKKIRQVYASVLGRPEKEIKLDHNFFRIGGNSLLTVLLRGQLAKLDEFRDISVAELFEYNSIARLAKSRRNSDEMIVSGKSSQTSTEEQEIAIIGLSGAFSGVDDIEALWDLVVNQREGYDFENDSPESDDRGFIPVIGRVKGVEEFDPAFWDISPREAALLNPQIRKFAESCWKALESAGYLTYRKQLKVGVFGGSGDDDYFPHHILPAVQHGNVDAWDASISNNKDAFATKVAFMLGLSGPAYSINTACSTGLVTIIEACKNLLLGTCDIALAGAASLAMPETTGYVNEQGRILSADGHCSPFDKSATGTVPGSGVATVVLRRLDDAIEHGDHIWAVIKGYASNNDADRKVSYTAPSIKGQSECIVNAQVAAGIKADDLGYIECHGTGTHLGDPIEIRALHDAFSRNLSDLAVADNKTVIGSVKANIGHADSASGIAGLFKVCAMFQHDIIPGQTNFSEENPELRLKQTRFEINQQNWPWPAVNSRQRLAGVSSFGIGGTNAHIVLGDFSTNRKRDNSPLNPAVEFCIPFSAKSPDSLRNYLADLSLYLQEKEILADTLLRDLSYTQQMRKEHFASRNVVRASSVKTLLQRLQNTPRVEEANIQPNKKVVFMFPGQGAQYSGMASSLYQNVPLYRQNVDTCITIANRYLDKDLSSVLNKTTDGLEQQINETNWAQISLFTVEYSLAAYLESITGKPDAYIGHSLGELVAATLAGVFSLESAIKAVIKRGQLMHSMDRGCMLAVQAGKERIDGLVKEYNCEIAVINTDDRVVVAGSDNQLQQLSDAFGAHKIPCVLLNTSHAFHSRMMESAAVEFELFLQGIEMSPPVQNFISNLTGKLAGEEVAHPRYWKRHMLETVRFSDGVKELGELFDQSVSFIEIGPGKSLSSFVKTISQSGNHKDIHAAPVLTDPENRSESQLQGVVSAKAEIVDELDIKAKLWSFGYDIEINCQESFDQAIVVHDLPTYHFDSKKCWIEKGELVTARTKTLRILPEENWLSSTLWSQVRNVNYQASEEQVTWPVRSLIFIREAQLSECSFASLHASIQLVVCVTDSKDYRKEKYPDVGELIYLCPDSEDHFWQLANEIETKKLSFDNIFHLGSVNNTGELESALANSFYSVFLIYQFLLQKFSFDSFVVLTSGLSQITGQDEVIPANGALVGALRTINHEFPGLDAGVIDVGPDTKNIVQHLVWLLNQEELYRSDELLAIRYGKLWMEKTEQISLSETLETPFKENDLILITGGLGGIALETAEHISQHQQVRFVLVSRNDILKDPQPTEYTKAKIEQINRIKSNGSSVSVFAADISSLSQTQQLINRAQKKHGLIQIIIHAAGVTDLDYHTINLNRVKEALGGKVTGIEHVLDYVDHSELRLLALTSSLSSIMGDIHRIEYCASNSYLDYLANDQLRFKYLRVVSINWPGWLNTGMAREEFEKESSGSHESIIMENAVSPAEGVAISFKAFSQGNYNRLLVSKLDVDLLKSELFSEPGDLLEGLNVEIVETDYGDNEFRLAQVFGGVLGVDRISLADDFFRIGGNSLMAIQVSHQISESLGTSVSVADIFKWRTISGILSHLNEQVASVITAHQEKEATLSYAQERLWFIEQFNEGTDAYHIPLVFELLPGTNIEVLKEAMRKLVSRHEVLRSTIHDQNGKGIQRVNENPIDFIEVVIKDDKLPSELLEKEVKRSFDLSSEYPLRVSLYISEAQKSTIVSKAGGCYLQLVFHHIATDGWSLDLFYRELEGYYAFCHQGGDDDPFPELSIQYKDYARWQKQHFNKEALTSQLSHWQSRLSGFEPLEFPTDFPRPRQSDFRGTSITLTIPANTSQRLRGLTGQLGTTLHSVLLGGFHILLSKYTNQQDIVTGSPIANRHHAQTADLIGFFVNTQVNRTILNSAESFSDLLKRVHKNQVQAQLYQDLPFEQLVEALEIERDISRHPIFQVMFAVQSFDQTDRSFEYLKPLKWDKTTVSSQFDFSLLVDDSHESLEVHIIYSDRLFKEATMSAFGLNFSQTLDWLSLHSEEAYSRLVLHTSNFNPRQATLDLPEETIVDVFQRQAESTPELIAVVFEDKQLTYQQLNEESNRLAHYLRLKQGEREFTNAQGFVPVPIILKRSTDMIVSIMAILKAGAVYVPIDPSYPQERIYQIIEDLEAKLVVTETGDSCNEHLASSGKELICIDAASPLWHQQSEKNLSFSPDSSMLAYIIFTSGTSGRPKGVMIEHKGIVNLVENQVEYFNICEVDHVLQYAPLIFDASVSEIFTALAVGACLYIVPEVIRTDIRLLSNFLEDNHISVATIPPALLALMEYKKFSYLKTLVVAGESPATGVLERWSQETRVINAYGPTESTVCATMFEYETGASRRNIGNSLQNFEIYILDTDKNPVPEGSIGELYISGIGLARGYYNQPDLTEDRFISNPFTDESREAFYSRMYRSGDLVKRLPRGALEYIGRVDDQIKLNGFRIELGEVEHVIDRVEGVVQSCVLLMSHNEGNKFLVAYYVKNIREDLNPETIRTKLMNSVPQYMVPEIILEIDEFPLTRNGKIDKLALPKPKTFLSEAYKAPETRLEQEMSDIWKMALEKERVGVDDDFFKIGGNSLMAIQVSHHISKSLSVSVSVADIFKLRTISGILSHLNEQTASVITPHHDKEAVLSYAQERLWFIERFNEGTDAYHIPLVFELLPETNMKALKEAIRKVVLRHEVLRSTIYDQNGIGIQRVNESPIDISEVTIPNGKLPSELLAEEAKRPFDLSQEYPLRVSFYTSETEKYQNGYLQLVFHHIATDGWSLDLFYRELGACYAACVKGEGQSPLPALSIQYKDYAQWQKQHFQSEALADQLAHWQSKLSGFEPLEFPTDFPRPRQSDFRGASVTLDIPDSVSQRLRDLAVELGTTLHSVLLGSFHVLLSKYTGQNDIITGSPIANRHHAQTADLIGFFVNTQVNRTELGPDESFSDLLKRVHEDQVQAQLHQDLPFEQLVEALEVERDISRHPIFQIMFTVEKKQDLGRLGDTLKPVVSEKGDHSSKFDLTIDIEDHSGQLSVVFTYAKSLFESSTIERLADYYVHLLDKVSVNPTGIYSKLSLLSPAEEKQILYDWNETEEDFTSDNDKTLAMLFEEQVENTPDATALVFGSEKLTYSELNEASNRLARIVRQTYKSITNKELAPDDLIGLYLERGLEMVVGILAVLKAGGAYVPIDANSPVDRTSYILEDTDARLVLSQKACHERMPEIYPKEQVLLIDLSSSLYRENQRNNLAQHSQSSDLAYVIYTSGTSGKPKGVMITHQAVSNYNHWLIGHKGFQVSQVIDCSSSYAFDATVSVLLAPLCCGKQVMICPEWVKRDPKSYIEYLTANNVDLVKVTPSYFSALLQLNQELEGLEEVKCLIFGGERIISEDAIEFLHRNPKVYLINHYGPTETTVGITSFSDQEEEILEGKFATIPIGKIATNNRAYVLDQMKQPVSIGLVGELHISGLNVSRGYLNDDELTKKQFVTNPFNTGPESNEVYKTLYKTGDLVRWRPDKSLEFIGRKDSQIKIRGYRVELTHIEKVISELPGIAQCCVLVRKRGAITNSFLIGYYKVDAEVKGMPENVLLSQLSDSLPSYMLPSRLVEVEHFPLNVNGKLDHNALPVPHIDTELVYEPPLTAIERDLCSIWEDVLGTKPIGRTQDFFRIGGDSILSIYITHRVKQAGYKCRVKDIFELKTIERLAHYLNSLSGVTIQNEPGLLSGEFDLLPIQRSFFQNVGEGYFSNHNHFNQSVLIKVPQLKPGQLKPIMREVFRHHDALRLEFVTKLNRSDDIEIRQSYVPELPPFHIHELDISGLSQSKIEETLTKWQSNFNIQDKNHVRLGYLYGFEDGSARIWMAAHHLIIDQVSWQIITDDIKSLYEGQSLPVKSSSYRQWVKGVQHYTREHKKEVRWWKQQINAGAWLVADPQSVCTQEEFELSSELTIELTRVLPNALKVKTVDLLLIALAYVMQGVNPQEAQSMTYEGHGRDSFDSSLDVSSTVGWFTIKYPVKVEMGENMLQTLQQFKEYHRNIPGHGIGFGAFASDKKFDLKYQDLPGVTLNYLGEYASDDNPYWKITGEPSGTEMLPEDKNLNAVLVSAWTEQNTMRFSVHTRLRPEQTLIFRNNLEEQIKSMVAFYQKNIGFDELCFAPSDFQDFVPYEILNQHLNEEPVFIFPPGNGGAESYHRNLISVLEDKKIVLFNNFYLYLSDKGKDHKKISFEWLASFYRIWIETIQPEGEITLCGYSFGGTLAFETARQLRNYDRNIHNLYLLDSFFHFRNFEYLIPSSQINDYRESIGYKYKPRWKGSPISIVLFKADNRDFEKPEGGEFASHLSVLPYNGLDHIFSENEITDCIKVVNLKCNHIDLLDSCYEIISSYIVNRYAEVMDG